MKKTGILHPGLSGAIARLGHTDTLVICDAGLPVPDGPDRVDLAFLPGLPAFLDVLEGILTEVQVEHAVVASEFSARNAGLHDATLAILKTAGETQGVEIGLSAISHEDLKRESGAARLLVRTGECTPFANVILRCGVPF